MQRTWRISATVTFPIAVRPIFDGPPYDRMPDRFEPVSRIPTLSHVFNGLAFYVGRECDAHLPPEKHFGIEFARIVTEYLEEDASKALRAVIETVEDLLDDLSFQLQFALQIPRLELLDTTRPLIVGEERSFTLYPFPQGYSLPKYSKSTPLNNEVTRLLPVIRGTPAATTEKQRAALRWFIKGIQAQFAVDKFIFFWVALEILGTDSNWRVDEHYKNHACGHEIPNCPICGTATRKMVFGKSIQRFLTECLTIDEGTATELWRTRQMLHGANRLTASNLEKLPKLLHKLHYASALAIKQAMNWPEDCPVTGSDPVGIGDFFLNGHRPITEDDIAISASFDMS